MCAQGQEPQQIPGTGNLQGHIAEGTYMNRYHNESELVLMSAMRHVKTCTSLGCLTPVAEGCFSV